MQQTNLGLSNLSSSRLVYGCMRLCGDNSAAARANGKRALQAAVDAGYNHFDHADIYGAGECESLFGEWLAESGTSREQLIIASKCGIRLDSPKRYDFSAQYITESVEGSLRRLNVDYLDLFMLHRPDYLAGWREVADTLCGLMEGGKITHCGVSNFSTAQVEALQSFLPVPLLANQVEINIHNIDALHNGVLDQCQQKQVSPVAWSPLAGVIFPAWGDRFGEDQKSRLRAELDRQCELYNCDPSVLTLAWLLQHPATILPIIGSTNSQRIGNSVKALDINYSREDWYSLLQARNGHEVA